MNEQESKELLEFASVVADMRHLQREYFRTKRFGVLEEAKRAEAKVDKYLRDVLSEQRQLFP